MGAGMSVLAATGGTKNKNNTTTGATGADGLTQTGATGVTGTTGATATEQEPPQPKEEGPKTENEALPLVKQEYIPQCGFEDDGEEWVKMERTPRIKESSLSPEMRQKFQAHVDKIFHDDSLTGHRVDFDPNDVLEVMDIVWPYLESEPMLIEDVPFDITIVGDLHGQLHDLDRVFRVDAKDGKPAWENMRYLFLGDYVDRGRQSLEILMALFSLKAMYPDRIFLLRGNHEFIAVNYRYGFPVELRDRYINETAETLFYAFNETFTVLSAAAIVGGKYFCAHGGVSHSGFTRRHLRGIQKPKIHSNQDVVLHDIVWSDPAKGLRGASFNSERHSSQYYGLDVMAHALASVQCVVLFRAHTMLQEGFEIIGHMCVSLFTATGMGGGSNNGAVAVINKDGKMRIRVLRIDEERVKWESILKKIDAGIDIEEADEEKETYDEDIGTGSIKSL